MSPRITRSRHERAPARVETRARPAAPVAAVILIAALSAGIGWAAETFPQITPAEVVAWQEQGESFLLIDTRPPQVYALKHARGAMNIPSFAIATTPLPREKKIVLYDNGSGSIEHQKGAQALRAMGYPTFWVLKGGLSAWEAQGYPIVAPPGETPVGFIDMISVEDLVRLQDQQAKVAVIDVRPRASFSDGHVPGAISASASAEIARSVAALAPGDLIVLYDDGTGDARDRAEQLRREGYRAVKILYGGMLDWRAKNLKVDK